jgi:hypothetical protein
MKNKNHDKIAARQEKFKARHLEKLADKMLKEDEKVQKLGEYKIKENPFDFFK